MDSLRVTYRVEVAAADAEARAEVIAREQTVEVPRSVVRDAFVEQEILGRVEQIEAIGESAALATIAYPIATTALDPCQLVNVIFGNTSLQRDVECLAIALPRAVREALGGPRFGLPGLREALGAPTRPLTCTAVKPMGLSAKQLAELCQTFARAGIDVIKDDHGLAEHAFCPFEERVRACLEAVRAAAEETGHCAIYAPNLNGSPETLRRQLDFAQEAGARAVLTSPMLIGLPSFWELCQRHASIPMLAHPAFGGAQRIAPEALFGTLYRLLGADAVIFVSFGSRFSESPETCRRLVDNLLDPWEPLLPSLPVPAGGITVESAKQVIDFYGTDAMLLVGGDLQIDADAILRRSRAFVDAVRGHHGAA